MSEPRVAQKGPYVKDETPGMKHWCACGHSANQPYCDGAHAKSGTGIRPVSVEIKEAKKVAWCGCKHSQTPPFCDGTHRTLP